MIEIPEAIADRLPTSARKKFGDSAQRDKELRAMRRGISDEVQNLRGELAEAQRELDMLEDANRRGMLFKESIVGNTRTREPDTARLERSRGKVADLKTTIAEHMAKGAALHAYFENVGHSLMAAREWVEGVPQEGRIETATSARGPSLGKSESFTAAIDRVRVSIAAQGEKLKEVRCAPIPSAEAKKIARAHVRDIAEKGCPNVFRLIEGADAISYEMSDAKFSVVTRFADGQVGEGRGAVSIVDPAALLAWLNPEAMIAALEREIDAAADDAHALDAKTRASEEIKILADILELERTEEGFIELAHSQGQEIMRRPDIDPRAFLGVICVLPGLDS